MAEDNRLRGAHPLERGAEQASLRIDTPAAPSRSRAVARSRPVESENAVIRGEMLDQPACGEVLRGGAIAMDQKDRLSRPGLEIVEAHAVDRDEFSPGRMAALGMAGEKEIGAGRG